MFVEPSTVSVGSMGSRWHLRKEKNSRIHVDLSSVIGSIDDNSACAAAAVRNFLRPELMAFPLPRLCFFVAHKFNASKRGAIFIAIISFFLSQSFALGHWGDGGEIFSSFFLILCVEQIMERNDADANFPKELGRKMWNERKFSLLKLSCLKIYVMKLKFVYLINEESDENVQIRWQSCSCIHAPLSRLPPTSQRCYVMRKVNNHISSLTRV